MREQEISVIIGLLNSDKTDIETGEEILKNINKAYNCLDSYTNISKHIFDNLTKSGKDRFYMIWCMAGFDLSYSYMRENRNPWDDRKKASMQFAFHNIESIESMFNLLSDLKIDIYSIDKSEMENKLFDRWFTSFVWNEKGIRIADSSFAWLYGFVKEWIKMHSTLKQSYYGGACNGVVITEKPKYFKKMDFPFI